MEIILGLICGLFIILGFEIRNRLILEQLSELKDSTDRLREEIIRLNDELKKKQNILEEI